MKKFFALIASASILLLGFTAPAANAAPAGSITGGCGGVVLSATDYPAGTNSYRVTFNGGYATSGTFGANLSKTVAFPLALRDNSTVLITGRIESQDEGRTARANLSKQVTCAPFERTANVEKYDRDYTANDTFRNFIKEGVQYFYAGSSNPLPEGVAIKAPSRNFTVVARAQTGYVISGQSRFDLSFSNAGPYGEPCSFCK